MLQTEDHVVENAMWLRSTDDRRHINVAELELAIKALGLAAAWQMHKVSLMTAAGWLQCIAGNTRRVKVGGLHEVLVKRRLQVVKDLILTTGMEVAVVWVPSADNRADQLTRVPSHWIAAGKKEEQLALSASAPSLSALGPVTFRQIALAQQEDPDLREVVQQLTGDVSTTSLQWKKGQGCLSVEDGLLYRQHQDPVDRAIVVPVISAGLHDRVFLSAHVNTGHGNWEVIWDSIRKRGYFPKMAAKCQEHVWSCGACRAANPSGGEVPRSVTKDVPVGPWDIVQIDTLELGPEQGST